MKKSIIIAIIGLIISIIGFVKGDIALAVIVLIVFLGVAAALFLKDKKKGTPVQSRFDEGLALLKDIDGWHLAYSYNHKLCIVKGEAAPGKDKIGAELTFVQEPDNEFDKEAVKVCIGSERIGYVFRSDHQEMMNDYLGRGWLVRGYLVTSGNDARYVVGFYKPIK